MDSKRRMIEINIWDRPFFSDLEQTGKLFWWFVNTKCDNVGVYQHNPKLAAFHCGAEIDLKRFREAVNRYENRIVRLNDSTLWIKDFIRDTWGTIAAGNNLGISCYKLLVKHGLLSRFIDEYPDCINIQSFTEAIKEGKLEAPLPQSSPRLDPDQEQSRGKAGTINNTINTSNTISNSQRDSSNKRGTDVTESGNIEIAEKAVNNQMSKLDEDESNDLPF